MHQWIELELSRKLFSPDVINKLAWELEGRIESRITAACGEAILVQIRPRSREQMDTAASHFRVELTRALLDQPALVQPTNPWPDPGGRRTRAVDFSLKVVEQNGVTTIRVLVNQSVQALPHILGCLAPLTAIGDVELESTNPIDQLVFVIRTRWPLAWLAATCAVNTHGASIVGANAVSNWTLPSGCDGYEQFSRASR